MARASKSPVKGCSFIRISDTKMQFKFNPKLRDIVAVKSASFDLANYPTHSWDSLWQHMIAEARRIAADAGIVQTGTHATLGNATEADEKGRCVFGWHFWPAYEAVLLRRSLKHKDNPHKQKSHSNYMRTIERNLHWWCDQPALQGVALHSNLQEDGVSFAKCVQAIVHKKFETSEWSAATADIRIAALRGAINANIGVLRGLYGNPLSKLEIDAPEAKHRSIMPIDQLASVLHPRNRFRVDGVRDGFYERMQAYVDCGENMDAFLALHPNVTKGNAKAMVERKSGLEAETDIWRWMWIMTFTGMRPTEGAAAYWEMIHWQNNTIVMRVDHPGNKTGVLREIPIFPLLRDWLEKRCPENLRNQPYAERSYAEALSAHAVTPVYNCDSRTFSLDRIAAPDSLGARNLLWRKYWKKVHGGHGEIVPYSLRHTFASLAYVQGFSVQEIGTWMGHRGQAAGYQTEHYAQGAKELKRRFGQDIGKRLGKQFLIPNM